MGEPLKGVVVGLRMGKNHALAMAGIDGVRLAAVCDVKDDARAYVIEAVMQSPASPDAYSDYSAMLDEVKPEIVAIATPNRLHSQMAIEASEKGVAAICCEKPIAVDLGEARQMVDTCRRNRTLLIVNHQRRLGPDFGWIKQQIDVGAIGDVYLVRGNCAGDMLSDGTHLIDSTLFLTGDVDWKWVFAAHHREDTGGDVDSGGGYNVAGGWRFGHPVENGMFTLVELSNGIKVEMLTGDLRDPKRPYHDVEIIGTKGSFWRSGDRGGENLFHREPGGAWAPVASVDSAAPTDLIAESYRRLVLLLQDGRPDSDHPLGADFSMRGFELLMGAYESARTRSVITPPVSQDRYPLAVALGLEE
jgi:predicted dehydrogenase